MGELFNIKKMEKSINRAKRRSTWKTVLITVIVLFAALIVGFVANSKLIPVLAYPIEDSFHHFQTISGPNEFIGIQETYPGILGGETHYKKYKLIEGKIVYIGEGGYGYGLFRDERLGRQGKTSTMNFGKPFNAEYTENVHYNDFGYRTMNFYYPQMDYEKMNDDLALLDEIPEGKLVEIALSFDKGYTSRDAMALIPKGITKTWLWVNDVYDEDLYSYRKGEDGTILSKTPLLRHSSDAYGFSVIDVDGEPAFEPAERFIGAISSGTKFKARWQGEFKRLHKTIAGDDGKLSVSDLIINGIVVTGTAEGLKQLQGLPFIKASSLGVVVDKY
ncbi:anti sigma factor C-terminal domain-containing protein [Solibacillus silvestris]|uniref:anti sigma factor C-terminal domain-containing protein n=1 Tax=Solibacillus silvestris TaxID=76853 RepID=UPI003F816D47